MKYLLILFIALLSISCFQPKKSEDFKILVYGWLGGPGKATDQEIIDQFTELKIKGIDGLMYNGGQNPETYRRVGKIAKEAGLEFHTWIPTMVQKENPKLKPEWYAINGKGESAFDKPAYVPYYKFLCPNREGVYQFLAEMYG